MRTTLNTIYSRINTNLGKITSDMGKINDQISSGMQMGKLSEEPVNLVSALRFRSTIAELDQYTENIQSGNTIITAAESALTQMKDLALRAKTLAIQATDPGYSSANREAIAEEIKNMSEQAVSLANTQVNGKYIFGGFRTTGYTETEPAPFMIDKGDGYWVNGRAPDPLPSALTSGQVTAAADLLANDLLINGIDVGPVVLTAGTTDGLNMTGANNLKAAINTATAPTVSATLTTLTAGVATVGGGGGELIDFTINGVQVTYTSTVGGAGEAVAAIEAVKEQTGVTAIVGDGSNGGPAGAVVLRNTVNGDESTITVSGLTSGPPDEETITGLIDGIYSVGPGNNTGQISLSSSAAVSITTSAADDTILNRIGLGGGSKGNFDAAADGQLVYGYPLTSGELKVNGFAVPATTSDGLSDSYADASAAAKATAINSINTQTGVTAVVLPAQVSAARGVTAGTIDSNDLFINGIAIFAAPPSTITNIDRDNTLINAINAKTSLTGVQATRDEDGVLLLTAQDGRNLHIETSTNGEAITHLTDGRRDLITFGALQLRSDRKFILETVAPSVNATEPGLAALGLAGGEAGSGEPDDVAADGRIDVFSVHNRTGSVRYAGDRVNDLEVKIGKTNTMTVGENGKTGVMDTTIFSTLKAMENYLRGDNFTTVTGIHAATDRTALLNSKTTGLEPVTQLPDDDLFADGSFTVSVTDHDYHPPRTTQINIAVDPSVDTLDSITTRLDGIANLNASWTNDGQLKIESSDPARYTIDLTDDSSNFLKATGVSSEFMESQGILQSITDLDTLMEKLTQQVSDFGSRANRIDIQSQIYSTMTISTKENLSEVQDTDMIKAVMDLKAKETAYQAALSAAAKTMQLSLVDYLR